MARGFVADALFNVELDREPGLGTVESGEVVLGVDDLKIGGRHDVASADLSFTIDFKAKSTGAVGKRTEADALYVEQEFDDFFPHVRDGGVLVVHSIDLDPRDRGARERIEQRPAHRVAKCDAPATLERLGNEPAVSLFVFLDRY